MKLKTLQKYLKLKIVSEKRNKVMKLNKKNEVKKMGTREDWSFNPE